jgi:hypothetical protein
MGIRSLRTASISTGVKRSKVWDQSAVYSPTAYESIATQVVGSGGTASITFSSIPSSYKHLQIRCLARTNQSTDGGSSIYMRLNADTGSNYSRHFVGGYSGASAATEAIGVANSDFMYTFVSAAGNNLSNVFGASVIDLFDYSLTSKFKTSRSVGGYNQNNAGGYAYSYFMSNNWRNTNAVTSITLYPATGSFVQYSHFALYGIKG